MIGVFAIRDVLAAMGAGSAAGSDVHRPRHSVADASATVIAVDYRSVLGDISQIRCYRFPHARFSPISFDVSDYPITQVLG